MKRDLEQARDLELALVRLRWLFVAYGAVQTVIEAVDPHAQSFAATLGASVTLALALGNVAFRRFAGQTTSRSEIRWIGAIAFVLDTVVVLVWVWIAANEPSGPEWVLAFLLPLEGALRYGLPGAFAPLPILLVSELVREMSLAEQFPAYPFSGPAVAFRVGMAAVIALVAGLFANSLGRERDRATERTEEAERAAALAEGAARREAEARRDLSAFHTAIRAGGAK